MKKRKVYHLMHLVLAVLLSVYMAGCAAEGESTAAINDDNANQAGYKVYCIGDGCGDGNQKALNKPDNSEKLLAVLPASADQPPNSSALSGAKVTFFSESLEPQTAETDERGYFEIPDDVLNNVESSDNPPEVVVTDAEGNGESVSTILPVAQEEDDLRRHPEYLKIIPMNFVMPAGGYRFFHAVKVFPNGDIRKARNVDWNCDAARNGILSEFFRGPKGSFVICKAGEDLSGEVKVSGVVETASGFKIEGLAHGKVFLRNNSITVTGAVFDPEKKKTAVGKGYLVSFHYHSDGHIRPHRFIGRTNKDGVYKVSLPEVGNDEMTYQTLIRTPRAEGGNLHKAIPDYIELSSANNGEIVTQDLTIGEMLPPFFPPPSFERVIRHSWRQVKMGTLPFYFEPFHGIRRLFHQPNGTGEINHPGIFKGWCYDKNENDLTVTPPDNNDSCPNVNTREKIEVTKEKIEIAEEDNLVVADVRNKVSYKWVRLLKPEMFANFHKASSGNVTDTVNCFVDKNEESVEVENCRISKIDSLIQRFFLDLPDDPKSTGIWNWARKFNEGPVINEIGPLLSEFRPLHKAVEITGKVCSGNNKWDDNDTQDKPCGEGAPIGEYFVRREKPEAVILKDKVLPSIYPSLLFTFYGNSTQYVKTNGEMFRKIFNRLCSEKFPCEILTDRSGHAIVKSFTNSVEDWKAYTRFKILSLEERMKTDLVAKGSLTIKLEHVIKRVRFVIDKFGNIHVIKIWRLQPEEDDIEIDDDVEFEIEPDSIEKNRLMMFDS